MTNAPPHADPIDIHVGLEIRRRRKHLSLSQSALAEALGLTFQQVQKYERGANRVSASMLFKIAKKLETSVASFFEGLEQADANEDFRKNDACIARAALLVPSIRKIPDIPVQGHGALNNIIDAMVVH